MSFAGLRGSFWKKKGGGEIISPTLGKDWTVSGTQPSLLRYYGMATNNSRVVIVADGGTNPMAYSDDYGNNWTQISGGDQRWRDVCYSEGLSLFVAVSLNGTQRVATSPDGTTWTLRTAVSSAWLGVCYSESLSLFVAVGVNAVMTSPDGITWTSRTPASSSTWRRVIYIPSLGLFIAVGTNAIMTSPDGITWTSRTMPVTFDASGIAYNGTNVVLNKTNNSTLIAVYSTDGVTWTASVTLRSLARAGNGVVYGQGKFFSLSPDIYYSEDEGVTWSNSGVTNPGGTFTSYDSAIFVNGRIIFYEQNIGIHISE